MVRDRIVDFRLKGLELDLCTSNRRSSLLVINSKNGSDLRHYPSQIVILTEIKIIFLQYKIWLLNIAINLIFKIIRLGYRYGGAV